MKARELTLAFETATLRLPAAGDESAIVAYYERNRSHFGSVEPRRSPEFYTVTFWRDEIGRLRAEWDTERGGRFFLFENSTGECHAMVSLSNVVRGAFQACTLGYALDEGLVGRGMMTSLLRGVIDYAFAPAPLGMGLHRVMANHLPDNAKSAAVLARLGFATEGHAKEYLQINGQWRDHVLNALVNDRWVGQY